MSWKIGAPSLKLNNAGVKTKNCGDFGSVAREALQEREGHDPDIDPERAALNRFQGYQTAAELQEYSRKHIAELSAAQQAAGGRKVRNDAVVMCATVLKPPAAMMATLSHEDQGRFLDDAYEAFAEIVGRDNIKSRADHYDEQGAHSHVFWEPMTKDGRLCAKEMHSLKFFGRVNRELPEKLRAKGWDIENCEMYDAAKEEYEKEKGESEKAKKKGGQSSYTYKAQAEREKRALEAKIGELQAKTKVEEMAAQEARQDAKAAQAEAEALKAAVQPPEAVEAITVKKTMGGDVKLSQADYELLRKNAEAAAVAQAAAREMAEGWSQMEADAEAARREAAELRQHELDRQLKLYDLQRQVQTLEAQVRTLRADNRQLREHLNKMCQVLNGQAGILSKLVQLLPGALGNAASTALLSRAVGVRFGNMEECVKYFRNALNKVQEYDAATASLLQVKKEISRETRSR